MLGDFLEDSEEEDLEDETEEEAEEGEEQKVELTEEQIAEWTAKWLKLFQAVDAYDLQPDEDTFKAVCDTLLDMTEEKPEITFEKDSENGISLRFDEKLNPTATPAPSGNSSSGGSSSGGTKKQAKELVTLQGSIAGYNAK